MRLVEGGNVFKTADGSDATQRINRADIAPTVQWLEQLTGLNLIDNMLGSTGYKETSGDLDLAVDSKNIDKDTLIQTLLSKGISKADIRKTGDSVHFKTPILGNPRNGFVQTDFMFGNPDWQKFSMVGSPEGSTYKGVHRHLLLASIAEAQGMKWSYKNGLMDRVTNKIISQDPTIIAQKLIGGTAKDISSVDTILTKIKGRSDYAQLTADARETMAKEGIILPESIGSVGSPNWFRTWSNML